MINHPKGLSVFSKGILTLIFFMFSFGAYADDTVSFLGEDSGISDRTIRSGVLLSEYLEGVEDFCLSVETEEDNDGKKDKTVKKQAKCLKKLVKPLSKHKPTDISKSEKKTLKNIIKAFKKNGGFIDPEPEVLLSTVNGRVTEPNDAVVVGANITVIGSDATATTGTDGTFTLELEADKEYVLQLTAANYANQVSLVKSPTENKTISFDLTMIARGVVQTFTAEDGTPFGSPLIGNDGASVSLQSNSFVYADGITPVTGEIQLTITPVDVSNPASLAAFPGEFTGTQLDTTETPIISFGTVEYKFTKGGEEIQLADGATAVIEIPLYIAKLDGVALQGGEQIELWSLDEETGIWQQESAGTSSPEGFGTVVESVNSPTRFALQATVDHFTWWNADVPMDQIAGVDISVNAPESGSALIKVRTPATVPYSFNSSDTVINVGDSTGTLDIPSNVEVCFWAEISFISGTNATTAETCLDGVAPGVIENVDLVIGGGVFNITANPNIPEINAFINNAVTQVIIQPTTVELMVNYEVIGTLPPGLSLSPINSTSAVISGIASQAGTFVFEVKGVNQIGEESTISITYIVSSDAPPADSEVEVRFFQNPVSVRQGMDSGTFFFEILPLGIIDGVYFNDERIGGDDFGDIDCDQTAVDLEVVGTYQMACISTFTPIGETAVPSILTVNVVPPSNTN